MMKTFLFSLFFICYCLAQSPKVPGFNNIGQGFDLVTGAPTYLNIISFTFAKNQDFQVLVNDRSQSWLVPDQITPTLQTFSKSDTSTNVERTTKQVSEAMSVRAGLSGMLYGAEFSLSSEVRTASAFFSNKSGSICEVQELFGWYYLSLPPPAALTAVDGLANYLKTLPTAYDYNTYFNQWIKYYGTHYISRAYFGGKLAKTFYVNEEYTSNKNDNQISIDAQVSYLAWKVSTGFSYNTSKENTNFVSNSISTIEKKGGNPEYIESHQYENWVKSIKDAPVMIDYDLQDILDVLPACVQKDNLRKAILEYYKKFNINPDSKSDPTSCRLCKSCGGKYPQKMGGLIHKNDWGRWSAFADNCENNYAVTFDEVSLCCSNDPPCTLCTSCGGAYPAEVGRRLNQYDWGYWNIRGGQCSGSLSAKLDEFSLCCKNRKVCRLCNTCGTGFVERGKAIFQSPGDWGSWSTYDQGNCNSQSEPAGGSLKKQTSTNKKVGDAPILCCTT